MKTEAGKTALITGASSGIGRELATLFAKDGYNLVLVARSGERLNDLADKFKQQFGTSEITVIEKDLSDPDAPRQVYNEVTGKNITVNVLVNNAGFGEYGKFATETDLQKELNVIQVNLTALVYLTKLFSKDMVARNEGKILMLGSIASIMPNPMMAVYGATKAFIYSFSEALRNEVKDTDVTVTVLMPPATDTDFFNKAGAMNTVAQQEAHKTDPADVAKAGYDALMKGKDKVVAGFQTKIQAVASRVLPDSVVTSNVRAQMKPQGQADEDSNTGLWLTIGAAAFIAAGLVIALTHKNAGPLDKARYAYKKGKAKYKVGKAKRKAERAIDTVTDEIASVYHDVEAKAEEVLA
ncbi:MAG: SDR family oxidoreductase [Spirosoma sp.]|nr:SDR family oxidoreductase [Spirosoma sp.]